MREVKTFFSQGNSLNKGYASLSETQDYEDEKSIAQRKIAQNLPAIDLMISYEKEYPGTFEKLLKMAEKEQAHRHNAELVNIQMHSRAISMGRLFGFFTICAIGYITVNIALFQLAMSDTMAGALIFAAIAFAGIFGVSFMSYFRTSGRYNNDRRRNHDRYQQPPTKAPFGTDKGIEKKEFNDASKARYGNGQRRRRR